jgi:predicted Fe-Mo cluster-binding NifX family protein
MERIIVVPTSKEGGIQSYINTRFGRTELFTLVKIKELKIISINIINNIAIQSLNRIGVQVASLMKDHNVTDAIVRKIGNNLFSMLKQLNIRIYYVDSEKITVKNALDLYLTGKLKELIHANATSFSGK